MPVRPSYPENKTPTRPTRQKGPTPKTAPTPGSKTQKRAANLEAHKRGASTK